MIPIDVENQRLQKGYKKKKGSKKNYFKSYKKLTKRLFSA